jgi:hypothetical protein
LRQLLLSNYEGVKDWEKNNRSMIVIDSAGLKRVILRKLLSKPTFWERVKRLSLSNIGLSVADAVWHHEYQMLTVNEVTKLVFGNRRGWRIADPYCRREVMERVRSARTIREIIESFESDFLET